MLDNTLDKAQVLEASGVKTGKGFPSVDNPRPMPPVKPPKPSVEPPKPSKENDSNG
ncbi:MAG: hypothetical protein H7844_01905 [Nitrospirae bacterium YQR-1]